MIRFPSSRIALCLPLLLLAALTAAFFPPNQDGSRGSQSAVTRTDVPETVTRSAGVGTATDDPSSLLVPSVDLGMNMAPIGFGIGTIACSEMPFTNVMKVCKRFDALDPNDSYPFGSTVMPYVAVFSDIDEDGYPREAVPFDGMIYATLIASGIKGNYRGGDYLVSFDGCGALDFDGDVTAITQLDPNQYRITVSPTTKGIVVLVDASVGGDERVRNIRVVEEIYADSQGDPIQTFHPDYLAALEGLSPKTLRFVNWKGVVDATVPDLADEAAVTHFTYDTSAGRGGVPHEVLRELGSALGADLWINIPYDADLDDYVQPLAEELAVWASTSGQRVYVEYGNEVWNSIFSNQYCYIIETEQGCASCVGGVPPLDSALEDCVTDFLVERSLDIFERFENEFDALGESDDLQRVLAGRIHLPGYTGNVLDNLTAADQVDLFAVTSFVGAQISRDLGWAGIQSSSEEDIFDYLHSKVEGSPTGNLKLFFQLQQATLDAHNQLFGDDLGLVSYEGGQSLLFAVCDCPNFCPTQTDPVCTAEVTFTSTFFNGLNRSDGMIDLYWHILRVWQEVTGTNGGPGAPFLHFNFISEYRVADQGSFGTLEYLTSDPAASPKYQALKAAQSR